jgi:1-acyl-sn-glycerol-3-phosphate acyltransferase
VPITINGAFKALPKGLNYITPGTIEMIIHPPVDTTNLTDDNLNDLINQIKNTIESKLK